MKIRKKINYFLIQLLFISSKLYGGMTRLAIAGTNMLLITDIISSKLYGGMTRLAIAGTNMLLITDIIIIF